MSDAFKLAPGAPLLRTKAASRLSRAVANPGKDAGKAAPFTPLWETFLARCATMRDQEAARELRWGFG